VRRIEALGAKGLFVKTDVSKRADAENLVDRTLATFGRLDYAVNNAGITGPTLTPIADVEEAEWDDVVNTNLKGVWLCMKYQLPAMLKQGHGAIVNISSVYGYKPSDVGHAAYCATKHAIIGLSKSAAVDYGQQGIRINVIAPGFTHSEMVDPYIEAEPALMKAVLLRHSGMNRMGKPDETAEAIAWLCSDAARFVNGMVLPVDGGAASRLY
jgi:NAD(P)-dependent dehydrogenase (short-subunit alcohol dehydrogenase family)